MHESGPGAALMPGSNHKILPAAAAFLWELDEPRNIRSSSSSPDVNFSITCSVCIYVTQQVNNLKNSEFHVVFFLTRSVCKWLQSSDQPVGSQIAQSQASLHFEASCTNVCNCSNGAFSKYLLCALNYFKTLMSLKLQRISLTFFQKNRRNLSILLWMTASKWLE